MFAHALIVDPRNDQRYNRGDVVPDDLPDLEYLVEGGSVSEEEYDPAADKNPAPDTVVIDGVVYKRGHEGAEASDVA